MLQWMHLSLLLCTRVYVRSAFSTLIGNQRHSFAFAPWPVSKTHISSHSALSKTRLFTRGCALKMRGVKKENLPSKVCVVCERPFTWRKKWERCWDEVTTCSKSCNSKRKGRKSGCEPSTTKDDRKKNSKRRDTPHSDMYVCDEPDQSSSILAANFANAIINEDFDANMLDLDALIGNDANDATSNGDTNDEDVQSDSSKVEPYGEYPCRDSKTRRKAEKKRMKAERRAQREGRGDPTVGQKQCTICSKYVNLLIRCQYDRTEEWGMVCGSCWKDVSGGVVDGDAAHPYYRYGGLWKNRRAQKA